MIHSPCNLSHECSPDLHWCWVGAFVGDSVGDEVGDSVGTAVGDSDGTGVGDLVALHS